MTKEELAAQIAAFAAKGGQVTKIETGKSNGFTSKEWNKAVRGNSDPLVAREVAEGRAAEARYHDLHDQAAEARYNGHRVVGYDDKHVYTDQGRY